MVYIDDMEAEVAIGFGGRYMKLCHMVADTHEELIDMANKVGVPLKYIQKAGTPEEHFDITKRAKFAAIKLGAKDVSSRFIVSIIQRKRGDNQPVEKKS